MKITVLTATCRNQYMKEQIKALERQSFTDFEWVLVDDFCDQNNVKTEFPLTHISPKEIKPYPAIASACNDGLIHSRGELIYFMNDYVLPHPDCLARHWEIYQKYKNVMISGRGLQTAFKPEELDTIKGTFESPDYRMWLFENFFVKEKIEDNLYEAFRDGIQNWWAGRNDSAPLEAILDCNGFDETFDGRWGGQDADLAQRLMTYGLRYFLDYKSLCLEFEHEHGIKGAIRSEEAQRDFQRTIIDKKVKDRIYTSGLSRNLKEERQKCLKN